MVYSPANVTHMNDLFVNANTVSSGLFGFGMVFTMFIILFLAMKQYYSTERSLVVASFPTLVVVLITSILGWISPGWLIVPLFTLLLGVVLLLRDY
jgi:hypothetical protein